MQKNAGRKETLVDVNRQHVHTETRCHILKMGRSVHIQYKIPISYLHIQEDVKKQGVLRQLDGSFLFRFFPQ